MADTWNEKLRTFRLDAETAALRGGSDMPLDRLMTEAAAELDRREAELTALEQALAALREARRGLDEAIETLTSEGCGTFSTQKCLERVDAALREYKTT
jgi:hypothetical protein